MLCLPSSDCKIKLVKSGMQADLRSHSVDPSPLETAETGAFPGGPVAWNPSGVVHIIGWAPVWLPPFSKGSFPDLRLGDVLLQAAATQPQSSIPLFLALAQNLHLLSRARLL